MERVTTEEVGVRRPDDPLELGVRRPDDPAELEIDVSEVNNEAGVLLFLEDDVWGSVATPAAPGVNSPVAAEVGDTDIVFVAIDFKI
jgi:hypothetical protein